MIDLDFMGLGQAKTLMHKTAVGFMAVWLSGVVFVFCCVAMNGGAMDDDSCPLAKLSKHCDKTTNANSSSLIVTPAETESFECCGFLPLVFDKARKLDPKTSDGAVVQSAVTVRFDALQISLRSPAVLSNYTHFSHERKLFIKNRVFRI